jgi:3-oxoadipate CoA-transferase beta subunit
MQPVDNRAMSNTVTLPQKPLLSREQVAKRLAQDLEADWVVNIGIGMPVQCVAYVPKERDVILHSENGIIGMGPPPEREEDIDRDLMSAGKGPVTLIEGGVFVHHADSFSLARGGRLDCAVLGAFQVAANGDLANWKVLGASAGNIGGAMDIAVGARRVFAIMTHVAKDGEAKLVERLTYPPTALGVVTRVYTDMAVLSVTPDGFLLEEVAPGVTAEDVQAASDTKLILPETVRTIAA